MNIPEQRSQKPMPLIPATQTIAAKWSRKAALAADDYKNGVLNTNADWASLTLAAAPAYKIGLQAAMAANRYEAGVGAAGTPYWRKNASEKGPDRYAQGVSLSGDNYARGFDPYQKVIANTALPPRGARGDIKNYERTRVLGQALNKARTGK
jgi:hypothetical protein